MIDTRILEITAELAKADNIVIVPHKGPDGDAMGSTLGLMHFLKDKGHKATVIAPNDYPHFLKWLPGKAGLFLISCGHVCKSHRTMIVNNFA